MCVVWITCMVVYEKIYNIYNTHALSQYVNTVHWKEGKICKCISQMKM